MARPNLAEEVIDACDIEPDVAREALWRALRRTGYQGTEPEPEHVRRALPELRRALESELPPAKAYDATERIEILLATRAPEMPSEPPSLEELTRRLREANTRMSSRDFDSEIADVEANVRRRRSIPPPR